MKKIIYILIVFSMFTYCKSSKQIDEYKVNLNNDFPLCKFQNIIYEFKNNGSFIIENEICCEKDLLDTKNKVIEFSDKLIRDKFSFIKKKTKINYKINEDETSKIWFIIANVNNTFSYSDEVHLIIIKNNSKVLYFCKLK